MSLLIWILCLFVLTGTYLMTPGVGVLCTLIMFIAAPLMSWLVLLRIRKKIQIVLATPGVTGKRNTFTLSVKVCSDANIPLGHTVMWLELTNTVTGEQQKKRVSCKGSGQLTLESLYCGCIECKVMGA